MQPHHLNTKKTTLFIRNMVSNSCIRIVQQELERTGFIQVLQIRLGSVLISYDAQVIGLEGIKTRLTFSSLPIIAVGGIKTDDINSLMETGIHGVAVSSAINLSNDRTTTAFEFNKLMQVATYCNSSRYAKKATRTDAQRSMECEERSISRSFRKHKS